MNPWRIHSSIIRSSYSSILSRSTWWITLVTTVVGGALVVYHPKLAVVVAIAVVGLAGALIALTSVPLRVLTYAFVLSSCVSTWFPSLAVSLQGLNVRPSQILLPVLLVRLIAQRSTRSPSHASKLYVYLAVWFWSALLGWTLINGALGKLTSQSGSMIHPLGHVFLVALNLLHAAVVYALIMRTGALMGSIRSLVVSVSLMGVWSLVVQIGAWFGIFAADAFLIRETAPVVVGGELTGAEVIRFRVGVVTGTLSAAVLGTCLGLLAVGGTIPRGTLWLGAILSAVGLILGNARAPVVTLLVAVGVIAIGFMTPRWLKRIVRLLVLLGLVSVIALWAVDRFSGPDFLMSAAFRGRLWLLMQPGSYASGTIRARMELWASMMSDVLRNPLWGYGQDSFEQYHPPGTAGSHNLPLEVLHAAGLAGLIPYVAIQWRAMWRGWRKVRSRRAPLEQRITVLALLAGYAGLWVASLTNLVFWSPVYWVVFGLLIAATELPIGHIERSAAIFPEHI